MVRKRAWTLSNVRLPFDVERGEVVSEVCRMTGCAPADLENFRILKRSVDSRDRRAIAFVYTVAFETDRKLKPPARPLPNEGENIPDRASGSVPASAPPVVVGAGPAGLFAALLLARLGFRPLVLERGSSVEVRGRAIRKFLETGELDERDNFLFGEGGAGAWSDGKLTGRSAGAAGRFVLETFVEFGAPREILEEAHPHIGSDRLKRLLPAFRAGIEDAGGVFVFGCRVKGIRKEPGGYRILCEGEDFFAPAVVFACGQNDPANYRMLAEAGASIELKPFQMGLRLEMPQRVVEEWAYGSHAFDPRLPRASWRAVHHDPATGLSLHTFCNCPGGVVIPTPSEPRTLCINGMSDHARAGERCNTALVATFHGAEFDCRDALDVLEKRREIERRTWRLGGGGYRAPAADVPSFLSGVSPSESLPPTTYPFGAEPAAFSDLLPSWYLRLLAEALEAFDEKMPGVASADSVLLALESRSSSPVRVSRADEGWAKGLEHFHVVGEGSGYAGGIMSSALDGLRAASRIASVFAPQG